VAVQPQVCTWSVKTIIDRAPSAACTNCDRRVYAGNAKSLSVQVAQFFA